MSNDSWVTSLFIYLFDVHFMFTGKTEDSRPLATWGQYTGDRVVHIHSVYFIG